MDSITFVSSLNRAYFDLCGDQFIKSFLRYVDSRIPLLLYCDGTLEGKKLWEYPAADGNGRVDKVDLGAIAGVREFIDRALKLQPNYNPDPVQRLRSPDYNYRKDAVTFGKKGMSLADALVLPFQLARYMFWCDADTMFKKAISAEFLLSLFSGACIVYFGRATPHSETGFIGFDRYAPSFPSFMSYFHECWYGPQSIFQLSGFTDCDAFDYALKKAEAEGLTAKSLSRNPTGRVIENSVLGEFMEHRKGYRKL